MKKFLAAALASMMLIGGAALALADGELNICSPNSDGLLSIIPVFEEQTGIKVKVESIGTGDCMKRIGSEIAQEYSTFDLMYGGSLANYVANADLFQDYVSDQDQYLMDAYKNTRGYCTNYTIDGSVLLVNTDMLKEMGIEVNGYADLLQPELVGKIASADPASSSSAFCQLTNMLLAMGGYEDDAAWQYVQDLFVGQQVAITSGSSAVYKGVYNGEYAVGLTYEDPCVTRSRAPCSCRRRSVSSRTRRTSRTPRRSSISCSPKRRSASWRKTPPAATCARLSIRTTL